MSEFTDFLAKGGGRRARDLTGQSFGKLTALSPHSRSRNGQFRWNCVCECGNEKDILGTHLVSGKTISCGCARPRAAERRQWTGHGEISGRVWNEIERGASGSKGRREIAISLTIEQAWDLFLSQDRKCALSGVPIALPERYGDLGSASLDRIDSSGGYELGNVQWLHKDINKMKNSFAQYWFIDLCKKVAGHCEI